MNTNTDFPENNVQIAPQTEWRLPDEDSPNYTFRAAFRPKLMEFFNLTNKKLGAYIWAEKKTKEWFKEVYLIPVSAWHYRNRREKVDDINIRIIK